MSLEQRVGNTSKRISNDRLDRISRDNLTYEEGAEATLGHIVKSLIPFYNIAKSITTMEPNEKIGKTIAVAGLFELIKIGAYSGAAYLAYNLLTR